MGGKISAAFSLLVGSYSFSLFLTKVFTVSTKPQDLAETHSIYQQWGELFPSRAAYEDNDKGLKANKFHWFAPAALKWCLFPEQDKLSHCHVKTFHVHAAGLVELDSSSYPIHVWPSFSSLSSWINLSVCPVSSMPRCGPSRCSGVSGAAGLHAVDGAREADHGLLPPGVPGGTHRSGAAGYGSVWALQHTCKGTTGWPYGWSLWGQKAREVFRACDSEVPCEKKCIFIFQSTYQPTTNRNHEEMRE